VLDAASSVLTVRFANPPVNALSGALREALCGAVARAHKDPKVKAILLYGESSKGFFSSGADIAEFARLQQQLENGRGGRALGKMDGPPPASLEDDEYAVFERGSKPVVAAIDGVCFGGGLELALACNARVCSARSSFALPELRLGLIPGLGGTQRLPRLIGFEEGLKAMIYSSTLSGAKAEKAGLVDELVASEPSGPHALLDAARSLALSLASSTRQRTAGIERTDRIESADACARIARGIVESMQFKRASAGGAMPQYAACVRVALEGVEHGPLAGLQAEHAAFRELVGSPTSKALVHLFFAQRATSSSPLVAAKGRGEPVKTIQRAGVVGGGLMGAGIATVLLKAGLDVVIKEINADACAAAQARVASNLKSASNAEKLLARLSVSESWDGFSSVDLAVEAALEDVKLKQEVFQTLERVAPAHCILSTNTSTINIDLVAGRVPRAHYDQGRVLGLHFFSPAHVMPLVEIVTTESTSPAAIQACLLLCKRMGKTPVVVGNCAGFAVNRMYFPQAQVASLLVARLDLSPYEVDSAMEKFGLPMGAFRLLDLVGIDIGVAVGGVYDMAYAERSTNADGGLLQLMLKAGRKGQKSGAGFYRYEKGQRGGRDDMAALEPFLAEARKAARADSSGTASNGRRIMDEDTIVEAVLLPCVNEACRILEERVVGSPDELDVCSVYGMGFPSFRGGLLFWAQQKFGGPRGMLQRLIALDAACGGNVPIFAPSYALIRGAQQSASQIGRAPVPHRVTGMPDDIVIVAACRTGVGRAYRGGFKDTSVDNMVAPLVENLVKTCSPGVQPSDIDDVVLGLVLPRGDSGVVMLRVAGVLAGLPETSPVRTVNRLCSSGLQAIADGAAGITSGHYKIVIAGGAESMSSTPFTNKELKLNPKAKQSKMALDCYLSMGQTSENVAARYGVSREKQDRMAVVSHARASAAALARKQRSEIVPIETSVVLPPPTGGEGTADSAARAERKSVVIDRDEGVRVGVTLASLAKLKPVFDSNGSTTAGNASQLSDGAAMVMLMTRAEASRRGLKPRATFRAFAVAGVDPSVMGIGPAVAIPAVLEKAGLGVDDIDLFEINEAFGSQAEYCIDKLKLNRDIVNVNGGAIAIGHPLGMSGARLSVSIINELERRGGRFGVVSMCIGTGMGAAAVYEMTHDVPNGKL